MKKFIGLLISAVLTVSGIAFVGAAEAPVYGDADGDTKITINDVSCTLQHVLTGAKMAIEENPDYMKYMDLNGDKQLDSADVAELLQMVLDGAYKPEAVPTTETTTVVTTETTTETTTVVTTETTTETTTVATTSDTTSETTTIDTSDGVVVDNFDDLANAVKKKNSKVYVKGTISCTSQLSLNQQNANVEIIGITNNDGTAAVLDFAAERDGATKSGESRTGVYVKGTYYTLKNLIVQNAGDCGMRIKNMGAGYTTVENCVFRYNGNSGISVTNKAHDNVFRNVDSYRNCDLVQKLGSDADGFSVKLNAGENNSFYNCRAWENGDDGWDSFDYSASSGPFVGTVKYEECLTWNNGNNRVFTGEYDYENGYALDKNLPYVQAILAQYPDFEAQYNAHTVTSWPKVTVTSMGSSRTYEDIEYGWAGNPNGFKFGSTYTPNTSYRYIRNCIAFDHGKKGFDQNNGKASYDIENALSFNNYQNYQMGNMTCNSMTGVCYGFKGTSKDSTSGALVITEPDTAKQTELENKVYAYRDMIYGYVYNDMIPGEQLCNVF